MIGSLLTVPITRSASRKDFAVMLAYFENGVGKFGIIYDVMKGDCGGGAFLQAAIMSPTAFKKKPLQEFLVAGNSGMFEQ